MNPLDLLKLPESPREFVSGTSVTALVAFLNLGELVHNAKVSQRNGGTGYLRHVYRMIGVYDARMVAAMREHVYDSVN